MQELKYKIGYNESINRWWVTDMGREPFDSPYETFEAEVNLGEAYVQIVYPVRKAFLKENRIKDITYYEGEYSHVYFPFENNRVDFTTFIHTPHYIYVNAKTHVYVDKEGEYPFELYTCGGMKIWVNGEEVECFAPYTRNIPGKKLINLSLKEGLNEIAVYADELAERDVFFYYELRYKGQDPITGVVCLDVDGEEIKETEEFLRSIYLPRDLFIEGKILLRFNQTLRSKSRKISVSGDMNFAKLNNVKMEQSFEAIVGPDTTEIVLGDIEDYNVGVFRIFVTCKVGEYAIRRELVVGIMPKELVNIQPAMSIAERKQQALDFICDYGENVVNRTMVILECKQQMTDIALQCMENSLLKIEAKEDCADFYLSPMLLLITKYRNYLTDELYERIKSSIINFRYWIDEPGNDVMWWFSENHALLFHIGQYLAGHLFADEIFTVSGRKGSQQYLIGKERLEKWFDIFEQYGFAEWNSATYIPVDLIGFFILYMMAPDEDIKLRAKKALDFTFKIMTYNSFAGIMSSSYGRAYEETLKARQLVEPNFLTWISYGEGYLTSASRAVSLFCLSDYLPPDYHKEIKLNNKEWMAVELDQGINKVKTYYYRTDKYYMACVRRFKPFVHGHQQHLMNVALGSSGVQYYINHPGERLFSGGNRPSYWAGNGTIPFIEQYKNLMVMIYKIDPEELVHYIHGHTPLYEYDRYEIKDNWFFIQVEDAYLGTYFSNGVKLVREGANTGKEIISEGLNHGIVIKAGSQDEFGSFEEFKNKLMDMKIEYDGDSKLRVWDTQHGVLDIQDVQNVTLDNKPLEYNHQPTMDVQKGKLD